jgi:xylulokinase
VNLDLWQKAGLNVDRLRVYGGLSQSDVLLQIKADVLGIEVARLESVEAGCFGAAVLAGIGAGGIADAEEFLRDNVRESSVFHPRPDQAPRHEERYQAYRELYNAVADVNHRLAGLT